MEFGVGKGESTRILAQRMPVIGFDAWLGLPTDWRPGFPKGSFAANPPNINNVEFVDGWYEDTLPEYDFTNLDIGLVHIDCDLYSSTATALKYVGPHLLPGAFIIFDEWHGYDGAHHHEQQAWRDYAEPRSIAWTVIGHGEQSWSIQLT